LTFFCLFFFFFFFLFFSMAELIRLVIIKNGHVIWRKTYCNNLYKIIKKRQKESKKSNDNICSVSGVQHAFKTYQSIETKATKSKTNWKSILNFNKYHTLKYILNGFIFYFLIDSNLFHFFFFFIIFFLFLSLSPFFKYKWQFNLQFFCCFEIIYTFLKFFLFLLFFFLYYCECIKEKNKKH